MKKAIACICLILLGGTITYVFWSQELIYTLPTPVPIDYKTVLPGQKIKLPFTISQKPVFLHFFNPDCPCSRFNIKQFKTLVRNYTDKAGFVVMVHTQDGAYSAEQIKNKFDLDIPVFIDHDKKIARLCGVYATPQAAIIDTLSRLYYRGNYNKARYCTDPNSNYAQIALDSLLKNMKIPVFNPLATRAYGCVLPSCEK